MLESQPERSRHLHFRRHFQNVAECHAHGQPGEHHRYELPDLQCFLAISAVTSSAFGECRRWLDLRLSPLQFVPSFVRLSREQKLLQPGRDMNQLTTPNTSASPTAVNPNF